jgi:hypothetical protein
MTNIAQIDRIISEVNELQDNEKIILFRKMGEILDNSEAEKNDDIPIESAFGLWKDRNITKEMLRKKAWREN